MGQSNGIHARRCVNSSHQLDITEISILLQNKARITICYEHRLLAMTSRVCCFVDARYASRRLLRCSRLLAGNVDPRSPASHDDVERRHGTRRHGHARTDVTHVVAHHHRTRRPVQRKICQLFCYCVLCVLRGERPDVIIVISGYSSCARGVLPLDVGTDTSSSAISVGDIW